jgi:hypothetical protein
MPVFNDWAAASLLVRKLDGVLSARGLRASIVIVDDGSTLGPDASWNDPFAAIDGVDVLHLRRNVGHQRAIAIGLAYLEANVPSDAVVVMDSDGEDEPSDVPRLLDAMKSDTAARPIVFARRAKRSEGRGFRFFYWIYRGLYAGLIGREIQVGNFSCVPIEQLRRLVAVSEIWNHYASGVYKSRLPCVDVAVDRGKRLRGESKMNFVSLVMHGLSAIAVHADVVATRAIVASGLFVVAAVGVVGVVLFRKFVTHYATPGWATAAIGASTMITLQALMFSTLFAFLTLGSRNAAAFVPARDFSFFVLSFDPLSPPSQR